ncbi:hypothetical protein A2697_05680 [Candidatus Curtissbacteria bacterium RIFCSPHIGHO2_01_FULL_41_44]|uniref:Transposase IS200-like domain-containing protein n=1 Tax=Candidatus Curtissbacteria bacterium RIFCSPLOWO2_01_FULL_42_50 TaxID=1797730 RepID=A0A1F5H610_9BACT|nr:MAG: hypothetical protein A3C33_04705 [Candidatus Curtissbacteria bacterium RIFCSPHIGHO2_02_FULL_42_58]OGD94440.1 MAG: hypothetical protein A2697_05680 [Candidatus Curtissbacteria bacterium RIFCSPHIGHO2_01_FULL_41_44]OGD97636.1 MAG: hypothetical protein A3E71_00175 [Candidatus Curtissbacteria bacterium RIFCSPHIGHO2_12_FULL_42_33]OGD99507.1 MAG: hypothetical protein A3B54_03380 [Candidatus Curtissbacteria bacterium RIFCSPLOWO2_01_FULL_42_50]OGE03798.1 MAG: hypothetical protein A3G16_04980 [Ca
MPSKHSVKLYIENGIYHVYNRGVEKRTIFQDHDYKVFLHYLKRYLSEPNNEVGPRWKLRWNQGLHEKLHLMAYCLMPNHFHLLLKQFSKEAITTLMRCLSNSYTKYFNEKYDRVGPLFQGKFKAVLVENDNYLLHLTRYIHLNPINHRESTTRSDLVVLAKFNYSSYADYLGKRHTQWLNVKEVLNYFNNPTSLNIYKKHSYKEFVEDFAIDSGSALQELVIE